MTTLIYASDVSLDGWTEDERGAFDTATPDDDVFAFITDLMRSAATYLYGRRMYDTMAVWKTDAALAAQSDLVRAFANVWQAADKGVYSSSLAAVSTAHTLLERHFDVVVAGVVDVDPDVIGDRGDRRSDPQGFGGHHVADVEPVQGGTPSRGRHCRL